MLKYLASDLAQKIDSRVVDNLRNFLFGAPGSGGFDLAAPNIQRGCDHGLADHNSMRVSYGLPAVGSIADITGDIALQHALEQAYGSVDNIDLWVGGLAEDHVRGASVLAPCFKRSSPISSNGFGTATAFCTRTFFPVKAWLFSIP